MNELSVYLKNIRAARNLSMQQVYIGTQITNSVLSRIENGHTRTPDPLVLKKLASFYEVSVIDIFVKAGYIDIVPQNSVIHPLNKLSSKELQFVQDLVGLFNENKSESGQI